MYFVSSWALIRLNFIKKQLSLISSIPCLRIKYKTNRHHKIFYCICSFNRFLVLYKIEIEHNEGALNSVEWSHLGKSIDHIHIYFANLHLYKTRNLQK